MPQSCDKPTAGSKDGVFDCPPFLPDLVTDMWSLGCRPDLVIGLLRPLQLTPPHTRVVDLGCGKGALGITLAKHLGFHVHGVDLCDAFLREARRLASEHGVLDRCSFERCDLLDVVARGGVFDVALFASLGGVLGKPDRCVSSLRGLVRQCGYMVIEGGFLTWAESIDRPGYDHYMSHERTLAGLGKHGDTLLEESIHTAEETRAFNDEYLHHIKRRAEELAHRQPEAARALRTYVAKQESECEFIDREITNAVWLLQRASDQ
jgi:SAM-dependent methyltransferase